MLLTFSALLSADMATAVVPLMLRHILLGCPQNLFYVVLCTIRGLIYHVRHSIYNISPHSSLHAYTTVLWHLTVFILTTMTHLTSAVSARHPLQSPWIRTPSRRNHALVRLEILLIDLILICNVSVPTACDWLQKCPRITRLVVDPQELCHELRHVELRFDAKKHMFLQVLGTLNQHCEDPRVGEELKGSYVFEQFRTTRCYGGSPTWLLRRRDTYRILRNIPKIIPEGWKGGV